MRSLCNGCGLQAAKRAKERHQQGIGEPTTPHDIYRELAAIGAERFKYPHGQVSLGDVVCPGSIAANGCEVLSQPYVLPPHTMERIQFTQERTQAQSEAHVANVSRKGRRGSVVNKSASPPEARMALPAGGGVNGLGGGAGGERAAASALVGMARRGELSSVNGTYADDAPSRVLTASTCR